MKKCVLVNCFGSSNENRVEPIKHWFEENGYETIYYSSDFHHVKKEYVELPEYIEPIKTKKYKKNISVQRIVSHVDFSKKIYALLKEIKPDVLYVKFPPNSLVKYAAKFKRKFGCYLIFDVFDLWPESLPISSWKKTVLTPLTYFWARPRNNNIIKNNRCFIRQT